jgi:hypothetical protein
MKRVSFNIGTHGVETTAAEMRRRLAQILSKIPGDQLVFFNLTLHLEDYKPAQRNPWVTGFTAADLAEPISFGVVFGELARPEND